MNFFKTYLRWLARPLAIVTFLTTSGLGTAAAGIVATDDVAQHELAQADRATLLEALGISPAEATDRIITRSDAELAQVMDQFNDMPADEGVVGFVIIVLIVFLNPFL